MRSMVVSGMPYRPAPFVPVPGTPWGVGPPASGPRALSLVFSVVWRRTSGRKPLAHARSPQPIGLLFQSLQHLVDRRGVVKRVGRNRVVGIEHVECGGLFDRD